METKRPDFLKLANSPRANHLAVVRGLNKLHKENKAAGKTRGIGQRSVWTTNSNSGRARARARQRYYKELVEAGKLEEVLAENRKGLQTRLSEIKQELVVADSQQLAVQTYQEPERN
ncbi:MAG TPA: hypothetical protein GX687_05785 [Clostridia bacterium]|jgi:hypothetical protein|nr:hypothetical protein [Clostridia bacterium]